MSQSLERALDLIEHVSNGHETLDELAAQVGVHKTTVLRLLRVLESRRYVIRDRQFRYRIGPALYAFSGGRPDHDAIRAAASEPMRLLGLQTGQTVHLAAYDEGIVTYIDKVESTDKLRMYSRIGLPAALHATAVAKILLGDLDHPELDRVLDTVEFTPFTEKTLSSREELLEEISLSRDRGWAVDHEEHETFMNCIGAGVRGADGRLVAAVSVSVPNVVLPYERVLEFLPDLQNTVDAISRELGFQGSDPSEDHPSIPIPQHTAEGVPL